MFHANAWGFPFRARSWARSRSSGPFLDGPSLLEAFQQEKVTITAGVPTIWMGILQVDASPGAYDTSSVRDDRRRLGGAAGDDRGVREAARAAHPPCLGMTETCPLGSVSELTTRERALEEEQYRYRAKQGIPAAFFEIRARGADGLVPWDGETMGELEVRGVWFRPRTTSRPRAPTAGRTTAGSRPATS